jgi:hypothetical protein
MNVENKSAVEAHTFGCLAGESRKKVMGGNFGAKPLEPRNHTTSEEGAPRVAKLRFAQVIQLQ